MADTLTFTASLAFLIGVLMVMASAIPQLKERFSGLLGYGFLLSFVGIIIAVIVAFVANSGTG